MIDLKRWLVVLRIPLLLLSVVLFFRLYNHFILDTNLQTLRASLALMNQAATVGQAEAALFLVDQALLKQMGQKSISIKALTQLQYTRGLLATGSPTRPLDDAQVMLSVLFDEQTSQRPAFLVSLDRVISSLYDAVAYAPFLSRSPPLQGTPSRKINTAAIKQALRWEERGLLPQASRIYEKLLKDYPHSVKQATLKLRLGYLYQKMHDFSRAEPLYHQVLRETSVPLEREIAHLLVQRLSELRGIEQKVKALENELSRLPTGPRSQRLSFELGSLLLQLSWTEKAAVAFHNGASSDPSGEFVLPCLFKELFCLRILGRFDEALGRYQQILEKDPRGPWAMAAAHQIAQAYQATEDPQTVAQTYEHLLSETQDDALTAVFLAQTGCTYLFDLNEPKKAYGYFRELMDHFPASPFSALAQRLLELDVFKHLPVSPAPPRPAAPRPAPTQPIDITPTMTEGGTPLMSWLENFLPIFVEVFSERLAKYMQAVGLKELTRKYTEPEFKELVVRRVRDRFPGQVTDIDAKIRADGFVGSGIVQFGPLSLSVQARIGIIVADDRPHVEIYEVKVGALSFSPALRKFVETRVNMRIDSQKYPLKVKRYELRDGYALISVELVK